MMPYEARRQTYASTTDPSASTIVKAVARWYGNDLVETDITIGYAKQEITTESVLITLSQTVPLAKTMDEQINRLRSWAEGRARNASVPRALAGDAQVRRMEL